MTDWLIEKSMVAFMWLVGLAVAGAVVLGIAWCVCETQAKTWDAEGTVMSRNYLPSTLETGVGPVIGGKGGVAITTTGHSESFATLIEVGGEVYKFENLTVFAKAKQDQKLRVTMKRNAVSGVSIKYVFLPQ